MTQRLELVGGVELQVILEVIVGRMAFLRHVSRVNDRSYAVGRPRLVPEPLATSSPPPISSRPSAMPACHPTAGPVTGSPPVYATLVPDECRAQAGHHSMAA